MTSGQPGQPGVAGPDGYVPMGHLIADAHPLDWVMRVEVRLNGEPVKDCNEFDDVEGWVDVLVDPSTLARERRYGTVRATVRPE